MTMLLERGSMIERITYHSCYTVRSLVHYRTSPAYATKHHGGDTSLDIASPAYEMSTTVNPLPTVVQMYRSDLQYLGGRSVLHINPRLTNQAGKYEFI